MEADDPFSQKKMMYVSHKVLLITETSNVPVFNIQFPAQLYYKKLVIV